MGRRRDPTIREVDLAFESVTSEEQVHIRDMLAALRRRLVREARRREAKPSAVGTFGSVPALSAAGIKIIKRPKSRPRKVSEPGLGRRVRVDIGYGTASRWVIAEVVGTRSVSQLFTAEPKIDVLVQIPGGERIWASYWEEINEKNGTETAEG